MIVLQVVYVVQHLYFTATRVNEALVLYVTLIGVLPRDSIIDDAPFRDQDQNAWFPLMVVWVSSLMTGCHR